jgi:hypothetical protein
MGVNYIPSRTLSQRSLCPWFQLFAASRRRKAEPPTTDTKEIWTLSRGFLALLDRAPSLIRRSRSGRNISLPARAHVHDAIPVHCEPADLATLGTGGTGSFAVGVATVRRIDILGFDDGKLRQ